MTPDQPQPGGNLTTKTTAGNTLSKTQGNDMKTIKLEPLLSDGPSPGGVPDFKVVLEGREPELIWGGQRTEIDDLLPQNQREASQGRAAAFAGEIIMHRLPEEGAIGTLHDILDATLVVGWALICQELSSFEVRRLVGSAHGQLEMPAPPIPNSHNSRRVRWYPGPKIPSIKLRDLARSAAVRQVATAKDKPDAIWQGARNFNTVHDLAQQGSTQRQAIAASELLAARIAYAALIDPQTPMGSGRQGRVMAGELMRAGIWQHGTRLRAVTI